MTNLNPIYLIETSHKLKRDLKKALVKKDDPFENVNRFSKNDSYEHGHMSSRHTQSRLDKAIPHFYGRAAAYYKAKGDNNTYEYYKRQAQESKKK